MPRMRPAADPAERDGSLLRDPAEGRASGAQHLSEVGPGNRALTRLAATGSGILAAQPSIALAAGNRAVQRLVAPVQRDETDEERAAREAAEAGGYYARNVTIGQRTGPLTTQANDGRPDIVPPDPVSVPLPGAYRAMDANRGGGAVDPHVVDSQIFKKSTTANDVISGTAGAGGGADAIGLSDATFGTHIANWVGQEMTPALLPGAALLTTGVGLYEGMERQEAHQQRADAMRNSAPFAAGRSAEILNAGAEEHQDAATRHRGRMGLNTVQAGLTAGGIITGNPAMLAGSAVLGGIKLIDSVRNKANELMIGEGDSRLHARELMDAALAGDGGALLALRSLGVDPDQLTAIEDEAASPEEQLQRELAAFNARRGGVDRLAPLMPKQRIPYPDVDPLSENDATSTVSPLATPDLAAALNAPTTSNAGLQGGGIPVTGRNPLAASGRFGSQEGGDALLGSLAVTGRTQAMDVPSLDLPARRRSRRLRPQTRQQAPAEPGSAADNDYVTIEDV